MTTDIIQAATNAQPEFKFRSAEIVGFGAPTQASFSAGTAIIEKDPVLQSFERTYKTAGDTLIAGTAFTLLGGPLLGATIAGAKIAHDVFSGNRTDSTEPKHGLTQKPAGENKGKIGFKFF